MYSFTLQFLIMASLAAIIYLVARTIPRIDENVVLGHPKKSFLENFFSKLPLEKIDLMFDNLLEKILRKFKIVVMKVDNTLTRRLSNFKSAIVSEKDSRPNIFENSNSGREDIK
ncbi:MAG: hypothetical protein AAB621_01710 [Patescibacteria group bacterium]